jgi:hypothetical protein
MKSADRSFVTRELTGTIRNDAGAAIAVVDVALGFGNVIRSPWRGHTVVKVSSPCSYEDSRQVTDVVVLSIFLMAPE